MQDIDNEETSQPSNTFSIETVEGSSSYFLNLFLKVKLLPANNVKHSESKFMIEDFLICTENKH